MNIAGCASLAHAPLTGTWFRAIPPHHWQTSLNTAHTTNSRSRFSAGPDANPPFEILYLCENGTIALEEVGAQFRHPTTGRIVTTPVPSLIVNVELYLEHVVDLTSIASQRILETSAQELTGDWRAYWYRSSYSSVPEPQGHAPTQELGQSLFDNPNTEAFLVMSAKLPDHKNLIVFPSKLTPTSYLRFTNPITNQIHTIP